MRRITKRKSMLIGLLVFFSLQAQGYIQSSAPHHSKEWLCYEDIKNNADFERHLAGTLELFSDAMVKNASLLEKDYGSSAAFIAAFSQSLSFIMTDLVPNFSFKFNQNGKDIEALGSWHKAINLMQNHYSPKIEKNLEKFLTEWLNSKVGVYFDAHQLESQALVRVVALNVLVEMATDSFYKYCLLPLFEEFYSQQDIWELRCTPKTTQLKDQMANFSSKMGDLIKTDKVAKILARTLVKSANCLTDDMRCHLADMLYPKSDNFFVLFGMWLDSPISYNQPVWERENPVPSAQPSRRGAHAALWFSGQTPQFGSDDKDEDIVIEYIE